jgi:hypothetical protein
VEWTTGWYYDAANNSVVFDVEPPAGQDLEISYLPIGSLTAFVLSDKPDPSSITVYVDGLKWTSDWAYDSTSNSIIFIVPMENGELIDVEYVPNSAAIDYVLLGTPDPATISVQVNGASVTNWTYEPTDNSITFTGSVVASATIEVTYLEDSASMSYALSDVPDVSSIEVTVNGTPWYSDWHYDSVTNSVVFDVEVADGQTIEVTYAILSTVADYTLSKTPVVSTITVSVNGVFWVYNWQYDSATNAIGFLTDLASGASVEVTYLSASASSTYPLSALPDETTLVVYVDGVAWSNDWTYDSYSNAIVFSVPLSSKAKVEVEYIKLSDLIDYLLSGNPLSGSIEVRVNGQFWLTNWTYDSMTNSVSFSIALPDGATVEIEYIDATTNAWYLLSDVPDEPSLKVAVDGVQWTTDWEYKSSVNGLKFSVDLTPGSDIEARYGVLAVCP